MKKEKHISILGGGIAGLAAGYYARKHNIPFTIYEASSAIGGNCKTIERNGFYFDTGAHRFHDKDPEITRELQFIMGEALQKINAPSQIFHRSKFIDFPLSPLNLLLNLGMNNVALAAKDFLRATCAKSTELNLKDRAIKQYGRFIASEFLLNYSEKLWGVDPIELSASVSGNRLKGLNLKTFLFESLSRTKKIEHLDGSFYYPKTGGYGAIAEKLADCCGRENIKLNASITGINHDESRIQSVTINQTDHIASSQVISTLPLSYHPDIFHPKITNDISFRLPFRNVMLVALFIDQPSVMQNATVYFPEKKYAFTRVYEPKNRSAWMSPSGQTSLIAEIPCWKDDHIWLLSESAVIDMVREQLSGVGWFDKNQIIDAGVYRLNNAYPVLTKESEAKAGSLFQLLAPFENLKITGRNGRFSYTHLHDMMRFGKEAIGSCFDE